MFLFVLLCLGGGFKPEKMVLGRKEERAAATVRKLILSEGNFRQFPK